MVDFQDLLQVEVPRGIFGGDNFNNVFLALLPVLLEQLRKNRAC